MSYEWQGLPVEEVGGLVLGRDPQEFRWGYHGVDHHGYGGMAVFLWFADAMELGAYLVEVEPQTLDLDDEDVTAAREEIREAVSALGHGSLSPDEQASLLGELDKAARENRTYEWVGEFDDLTTGDGAVPKEMRSSFRSAMSDSDSAPPVDSSAIKTDELSDFAEYISEYGWG